jgi:hypothetical protein
MSRQNNSMRAVATKTNIAKVVPKSISFGEFGRYKIIK